MMNDVVSRMVKEFPAETLRLIFSDTSEQFQIEKAVSELKVSAQFIKKWINENKLPGSMIERVETLYKEHLNKTVENLRKEANEKVRIRAV
jgi:ferric iron reductase protein FhuF